eukprot:Opistho-2@84473
MDKGRPSSATKTVASRAAPSAAAASRGRASPSPSGAVVANARPASAARAPSSTSASAAKPTSTAKGASAAGTRAASNGSAGASGGSAGGGASKSVVARRFPPKPQFPRAFPAWVDSASPAVGINVQFGPGLNNGNPTYHSRIYTFSGPVATKEDVIFEHVEDGSKHGKAHKLFHEYQEKRIGDGKDIKFEIEGRDFNPAHYAEVDPRQIGNPTPAQLKKFTAAADKIATHRKERMEKYLLVEERWAQIHKFENIITYKDVPWPDFKKKNGLLPFLLDPDRAPFKTKAHHEDYLRVLRDRWDVAAFDRTLGHRIADEDRERIITRVDEIMQIVGPKDVL